VFADCPGAGGAYHRFLTHVKSNDLQLCKNFKSVHFYAACDFNETSFSNAKGGIYSACFLSESAVKW